MSNTDPAETVEVRVEGEMSIEVILRLPKAEQEELLQKAKTMVRDALKQALNDIPEAVSTVEAYCEPYQQLSAEIDE